MWNGYIRQKDGKEGKKGKEVREMRKEDKLLKKV